MTKKLFPILAASSALLISAQGALVSHYSFDTDYSLTSGSYAGTLSEVESGSATVTAGSATNVFGGGAAFFSSNTASDTAYLDMSTEINFASNQAWSVSFWVNIIADPDVRAGMILGNRNETPNFIWRTNNTSQVPTGGVRYRADNGADADFQGGLDPVTENPVVNTWEHWVIIHDGAGEISGYKDNAFISSESVTGLFQNINTIGQAHGSNNLSLNGYLDELYIFDEAIDSTTIGNLYNTNTIPEPSTSALIGLAGLSLFVRRRR